METGWSQAPEGSNRASWVAHTTAALNWITHSVTDGTVKLKHRERGRTSDKVVADPRDSGARRTW